MVIRLVKKIRVATPGGQRTNGLSNSVKPGTCAWASPLREAEGWHRDIVGEVS